jgi:bifunctional non-homologous end joining protein LigD
VTPGKAPARTPGYKPTRVEVAVDGRELGLTSLEKVMYPAAGFTKAQVIDYYQRIAPAMLPHLKGRPLTRVRWPHGTGDMSFFEKRAPAGTPPWVKTAEVTHKDETIPYVVCDDRATLVWLANLNALELHPQLHLAKDPSRPTEVVFDLDPGLPAALLECCQVAVTIRDLLDGLDLKVFPKVSGGKGLQLYVPLNTPGVSYDDTKDFSRSIAIVLERDDPERVVSRMAKDLRKGKVFIDWSQNDEVKTTVGVYSLRGRERPTVSAPVTWEEVEGAIEEEDASELVFEADAVLERVEEHGDLFAAVETLKQRLPDGKGG